MRAGHDQRVERRHPRSKQRALAADETGQRPVIEKGDVRTRQHDRQQSPSIRTSLYYLESDAQPVFDVAGTNRFRWIVRLDGERKPIYAA
jgi:hypothetical protein